jgi:hypothetical protein
LNIECEHAISVAFVIGFGSLFCILLLTFIIVKRRYCLHFRTAQSSSLNQSTHPPTKTRLELGR